MSDITRLSGTEPKPPTGPRGQRDSTESGAFGGVMNALSVPRDRAQKVNLDTRSAPPSLDRPVVPTAAIPVVPPRRVNAAGALAEALFTAGIEPGIGEPAEALETANSCASTSSEQPDETSTDKANPDARGEGAGGGASTGSPAPAVALAQATALAMLPDVNRFPAGSTGSPTIASVKRSATETASAPLAITAGPDVPPPSTSSAIGRATLPHPGTSRGSAAPASPDAGMATMETASSPGAAPGESLAPTPAGQIMSAIRDLIGTTTPADDAGGRPAPTSPDDLGRSDLQRPQPTHLRALTVRLNPDHLGPVSITLRIKADGVEVRIAVANPETLQLLEKDHHVLSAMVATAGGGESRLALSAAAPSSEPDRHGTAASLDQPASGKGNAPASPDPGGRQPRQLRRSGSTLPLQSSADESAIAPPNRLRGVDGSLYL